MENILPFPKRAAAQSVEIEAGHLRRATSLKKANSTIGVLNASDRERAATNLHHILDDLRRSSGSKKSEVARRAGLGGNGDTDSSKRLDTYTFPPGAPDLRRDRLAVKSARFFDIAAAISGLSGLPEDLVLCRIFEGCSFGVEAATIPDWEEERWSILAMMVTEMSRAVIHDTDMRSYWKTVGMMQFRYDFETRRFGDGRFGYDNFSVQTGLANNFVYWEDAPPVPSVPLFKRPMAEPVDGSLILADGQNVAVSYNYLLVVSLAIGPTHGLSQIGPLLELGSRIEISTVDGHPLPTDVPVRTLSGRPWMISLDGKWSHVVEVFLDAEPEPEGREDAEHGYLRYFEISPIILRQFLTNTTYHFEWLRSIKMEESGIPLRFEWGSLGALLQRDLLDGSLERDLAELCQTLHRDLKHFQEECRSASLAAEAEAFNRWRRPAQAERSDA
jgi:hypothetical protein